MKILVYVLFDDLRKLEAGEKAGARAALESSVQWIQVMVDTDEYVLEPSEAFFGPPYTLQRKAGGRA